MRLYSEGKNYKLYEGSMLDMLEVIEPNSIDSIVTDPPYELNFMNKGWDNSGIAFQKETWERCYGVLKSGGYLLAFGGSRTYHRIACAIEDAGFEIRDTIMWLYFSGFPKSMNIGLAIDKRNGGESEVVGYADSSMPDFSDAGQKNSINKIAFNDGERAERIQQPIYKCQNDWDGWGTCLKPAYEPIIVARKPCEGSTIDNVLKYGVGGINVDDCRIPMCQSDVDAINAKISKNPTDNYNYNKAKKHGKYAVQFATSANDKGRFPSNVILTYDEDSFDEVCGGMPQTSSRIAVGVRRNERSGNTVFNNGSCGLNNTIYDVSRVEGYADTGSAARYFYCAKASVEDRDEGLNDFVAHQTTDGNIRTNQETARKFGANSALRKNIHPTVKPTELMRYLIRLVTPKGGTVLDSFNGSGSTGKACMVENRDRQTNYKYIGIELTEEYLPIADARISFIANQKGKRRLI